MDPECKSDLVEVSIARANTPDFLTPQTMRAAKVALGFLSSCFVT